MVNRKRIFSIISLVTLSAASVPLRADGILEQMQKEVAAIATRTRSAVVTIRDESAVASIHLKWNPTFNQNGLQYEIKRSSDLLVPNGTDSDYRVYLKTQGKPSPERSKLEKKRKELLEKQADKAKSTLPADIQKQIDVLSATIQKLAREDMITVETPSDVVYLPQSGSGFSIGGGYVVTTADVLTGMKAPLVITDNGTRLKAKIVGINNDLNVGLLKLEAKFDLPSLPLGDSAKVEVGHFAISVGNQGGTGQLCRADAGRWPPQRRHERGQSLLPEPDSDCRNSWRGQQRCAAHGCKRGRNRNYGGRSCRAVTYQSSGYTTARYVFPAQWKQ